MRILYILVVCLKTSVVRLADPNRLEICQHAGLTLNNANGHWVEKELHARIEVLTVKPTPAGQALTTNMLVTVQRLNKVHLSTGGCLTPLCITIHIYTYTHTDRYIYI